MLANIMIHERGEIHRNSCLIIIPVRFMRATDNKNLTNPKEMVAADGVKYFSRDRYDVGKGLATYPVMGVVLDTSAMRGRGIVAVTAFIAEYSVRELYFGFHQILTMKCFTK